jgi:hypothetical protein
MIAWLGRAEALYAHASRTGESRGRITDNVMNYERSLINQQVENGIAVRMSVLYWLRPGAGVDA